MKIYSLVRDAQGLAAVTVEISFLPGLPQIHFLGLPDQLIKESLFRIKSAFKACDLNFPKTHQIIVNIRPTHLKKSSRGLELAVALGILQATEQINLPKNFSEWFIYGELSLNGDVIAPEDLHLPSAWKKEGRRVLTGALEGDANFDVASLLRLSEVSKINLIDKKNDSNICLRPKFGMDLKFNSEQARFLQIAALGGHSALLAGPAGSGKSTLAKVLWALMPMPIEQEVNEIETEAQGASNVSGWRPFIHPHHTSTPLSMVGGGVPPRKGEVSRAHRGLLVLDELLEFKLNVQEALREPMDDAKVRLSRSFEVREYLAKAQYLGTTNLCPCGDWVPNKKIRCSRSGTKCRAYREKLSGPVLDRFQILFFCLRTNEGENTITGEEILKSLKSKISYNEALKNAYLQESEILALISSKCNLSLYPWGDASYRRRLATLRVALTIAQLAGRETIDPVDLDEAFKWTWIPHQALKNEDQLTWSRNQHTLGASFK